MRRLHSNSDFEERLVSKAFELLRKYNIPFLTYELPRKSMGGQGGCWWDGTKLYVPQDVIFLDLLHEFGHWFLATPEERAFQNYYGSPTIRDGGGRTEVGACYISWGLAKKWGLSRDVIKEDMQICGFLSDTPYEEVCGRSEEELKLQGLLGD